MKLAVDLIEQESGKFEPEKMPNEYADAVHELVQAKVEQRAPEVEIETEKREAPKVINIMDALKKSMQAKGQAKVRDAVRRRMGKDAPQPKAARAKPQTKQRPVARLINSQQMSDLFGLLTVPETGCRQAAQNILRARSKIRCEREELRVEHSG